MRSVVLFFFVSVFFCNIYSQNYSVYDGDTFSILLTFTKDNNRISNVEFSEKGKWIKFQIVSTSSYKGVRDSDDGFIINCKDGNNYYYSIDYIKSDDTVVLHVCSDENVRTNTKWIFKRRKDLMTES